MRLVHFITVFTFLINGQNKFNVSAKKNFNVCAKLNVFKNVTSCNMFPHYYYFEYFFFNLKQFSMYVKIKNKYSFLKLDNCHKNFQVYVTFL